MLYRLGKDLPELAGYVADSAQVIGKVRVMTDASVWMGAVLRGDIEAIVLGRASNVQENSSLHSSHDLPLQIGENVTIGHNVTLHSCTIGDACLVGMGATLLDGTELGAGSLVAAGSVLTPGSKFPEHSFIVGSPAKRHKELGQAAREEILANAKLYVELAKRYQTELVPLQQSISSKTLSKTLGEQQWKLLVYVPRHTEQKAQPPDELLEKLKRALFQAGAGELGLYHNCSWQSEGQGQFLPLEGSQPAIGVQQELCRLAEYKLELLCPASRLKPVLDALYSAHPYETPAYEIYPVYSNV